MTAILMVAIESVCLAFMLIILTACLFLPHSAVRKNSWYTYTVILTVFALIFDGIAWAGEAWPIGRAVQYGADFMSVIMANLIVTFFGYYVFNQINEKHRVSPVYAHLIAAANGGSVIAAVIGAVTDDLFDIIPDAQTGLPVYDAGGICYYIPVIVSALSFLCLFGLVLCYGRTLPKRKLAVFAIYFLLPLCASAIEMITEEILLTYAAVAVSMSIMYVMLQGNSMNEMILREHLLNELSYIDQLTGLQNRRACDRDIALARKDDTVGVVFCDLNGLKQINDKKGHKAGDEFLNMFAKIITKHFSGDNVYRISGDEFVIVARNMDAAEFETSVANLRQEIDDNAGIAALGTITGTGESITGLIRSAEMSMYADKKLFYRSHPDYKRGRDAYMEEV